ncbi:cytochrome b family protein [Halomonas halophila]|uniref:NnrU domain-containing protein n=1 Tax=Halomonas halophila TaxID=29573 RepID=A0ABQ0U328_9GAMM|nr:hypothetical protein HHA04nite_14020 [Halomonas halophila]
MRSAKEKPVRVYARAHHHDGGNVQRRHAHATIVPRALIEVCPRWFHSYPIFGLILLHFFWGVRADLGEWTLYAVASALIMATRLPPVARRLPRFRQRLAGIR